MALLNCHEFWGRPPRKPLCSFTFTYTETEFVGRLSYVHLRTLPLNHHLCLLLPTKHLNKCLPWFSWRLPRSRILNFIRWNVLANGSLKREVYFEKFAIFRKNYKMWHPHLLHREICCASANERPFVWSCSMHLGLLLWAALFHQETNSVLLKKKIASSTSVSHWTRTHLTLPPCISCINHSAYSGGITVKIS